MLRLVHFVGRHIFPTEIRFNTAEYKLEQRAMTHDEASSLMGFMSEFRTDDVLSNGLDASTRRSSEKEMKSWPRVVLFVFVSNAKRVFEVPHKLHA